ncbi:MAG: hypothetical protein OXM03_04530 [Chloroflexota bacterium]|nr:hypothetical protein [Chloroflexota bacterium]MDE2839875.1 hypothetical protein [Chloroflexota bacterium]
MSWESAILAILLAGTCTVLTVRQWLAAYVGLVATYLGTSLLLMTYSGTVVGVTRVIIGLTVAVMLAVALWMERERPLQNQSIFETPTLVGVTVLGILAAFLLAERMPALIPPIAAMAAASVILLGFFTVILRISIFGMSMGVLLVVGGLDFTICLFLGEQGMALLTVQGLVLVGVGFLATLVQIIDFESVLERDARG